MYHACKVMKDLKGKTWEERQKECPTGYWCYMPEDFTDLEEAKGTEIWLNLHGISCPVCKEDAVDTNPNAGFMCVHCGVGFSINIPDLYGRKVLL